MYPSISACIAIFLSRISELVALAGNVYSTVFTIFPIPTGSKNCIGRLWSYKEAVLSESGTLGKLPDERYLQ